MSKGTVTPSRSPARPTRKPSTCRAPQLSPKRLVLMERITTVVLSPGAMVTPAGFMNSEELEASRPTQLPEESA